MKYTLITTGGTIGSATGGDGVRRLADGKTFDGFTETLAPFTVFSENMTFAHMATLSALIRKQADCCDGIIVTHGTDTLPFTAAALSFTLADIQIPVVLVSANAPAGEPGSNADDNMRAALAFLGKKQPGIYAAYRNAGESAQILFGSRMLEARPFDGNYYAPMGKVCAYVDEEIRIVETGKRGNPLSPQFGNVVPLPYHPGVEYTAFLTDTADAYLLAGSHSGTVNTQKINAFAAAARAPVYLVNKTAGVTYQSTADLVGVTVLENIAYPAAFVKLALLYGNDRMKAAQAAFQPITDEIFSF